MVRRSAWVAGLLLAGVLGLLALVIGVGVVTDRPTDTVVTIDRDLPEVVTFLEAERALMDHHDVDYTEYAVTVEDPALRVRVLEVGEGPPVLVLPPAAGEAARLAPLLGQLEGYRFLLVNLPGGGASDGIDLRAVDQRPMARATLDAVYAHFGLDEVPVVGASVGGTWALWYALDRPERVSAVGQLGVPVAVEGTVVPPALVVLGIPGVDRIAAATVMVSDAPSDAADSFEEAFGHPNGTAQRLPAAALEFEHAVQRLPTYALTWRSLAQDSLRMAGFGGWATTVEIRSDELGELKSPVLLVWPSEDPFGGPAVGEELAGLLPDARLHIAGTGHLPWLDDAEGVAELLDRFLDASGPAAGPDASRRWPTAGSSTASSTASASAVDQRRNRRGSTAAATSPPSASGAPAHPWPGRTRRPTRIPDATLDRGLINCQISNWDSRD
ncbi:alpha/beta hydrolase [Egibacter rhizosphaerae]|uniref:Alpha/beta hydrolase n=1 Tax=Egibacter rhizosphaerae TaxID=1670831 RepID=A0A411YFV9_9ACTN|nr:alpha/beta hydrolase [Egibacter rhizosphaerae]QBI20076.1 alpha/beta hydrolase [Egibacter rhizosphaerae]